MEKMRNKMEIVPGKDRDELNIVMEGGKEETHSLGNADFCSQQMCSRLGLYKLVERGSCEKGAALYFC